MAKAPDAGRIKTRLSPFLTPEEAKDLGCCFLSDMASNLPAVARELPLDPYPSHETGNIGARDSRLSA
jgi:hypothetical protein